MVALAVTAISTTIGVVLGALAGYFRGWVDAIIAPHTTRDVLIQSLDVATRPRPGGGFRGGVMQV